MFFRNSPVMYQPLQPTLGVRKKMERAISRILYPGKGAMII
jgi:hypothetical protein